MDFLRKLVLTVIILGLVIFIIFEFKNKAESELSDLTNKVFANAEQLIDESAPPSKKLLVMVRVLKTDEERKEVAQQELENQSQREKKGIRPTVWSCEKPLAIILDDSLYTCGVVGSRDLQTAKNFAQKQAMDLSREACKQNEWCGQLQKIKLTPVKESCIDGEIKYCHYSYRFTRSKEIKK